MSGEGVSSSLFFGEPTRLSGFAVGAPFSVPDADPPDGFRSVLGLDATRPGAKDKRPAGGRAAAELVLEAADDVEGCRVVLEAGRLGGPMDGRLAPTDGRGALTPAEATRAFDGVAVRELEVLDEAVASCLVGDLVGDLTRLEGRDPLGTGLGLGAFRLILLPRAGSLVALVRALPDVNMLLGRPPFLAVGPGAGFGGGWATTVTALGRQNMPRPMPPHSK